MNKCLKQKKQESTYRTNEKKFGCKIPAQPYTARACNDVDINIFSVNKIDSTTANKNAGTYFFIFFNKRSDSTKANILWLWEAEG